jgi:hypothetical protein
MTVKNRTVATPKRDEGDRVVANAGQKAANTDEGDRLA